MKRLATVVLAILAAATSLACLWDQDTLAEEARGKMDFVRIITGRFERNPPLYYRMRLERVAKELGQDPSKLDNYDNAAVACDRLANDEEAIRWIEKKRAYMTAQGLTEKTNPDDWYRYFANAGTFHAHLWFRHGANQKQTGEIRKGRDLLKEALRINPNSHFGRERVQLAVLDWVIDGPTAPLAEVLQKASDFNPDKAREDAKGLAGLVMLGNAWESVDTFAALQACLSIGEDSSLGQFAMLRAQELMAKGAKPLIAGNREDFLQFPRDRPMDSVQTFNEKEFKRLRAEADQWQAHRTEFMLARLEQGRHPDPDPQFWAGYTEAPAPDVHGQFFLTTPKAGMTLMMIVFFGILGLIAGVIVLVPTFFIVRAVRRRRTRRTMLL